MGMRCPSSSPWPGTSTPRSGGISERALNGPQQGQSPHKATGVVSLTFVQASLGRRWVEPCPGPHTPMVHTHPPHPDCPTELDGFAAQGDRPLSREEGVAPGHQVGQGRGGGPGLGMCACLPPLEAWPRPCVRVCACACVCACARVCACMCMHACTPTGSLYRAEGTWGLP